MANTIAALASEAFEGLTPAELTMLHAAENGSECTAHAARTNGSVLRSAVITWLCTDVSVRAKVHRHGLALFGFQVNDFLDLIHGDVPFPIQFHSCKFAAPIWLKGARLRSLSLRGSHLHGLNADSTQIQTNVLMCEGFKSFGEVSFREAVIGGGFRADGAEFRGSESPALVCDRISVSGGVVLSRTNASTSFVGEVRFSGANVGGNFDCEAATFSNPDGIALSADRVSTGGSIFLRLGQAEGEVNVAAAAIGVALDCRGASFSSAGERTLNAEKISVGSHVLLDGGFICDKVHLLTARIQGGLRCRMSRIGKLDLRHTTVEGPFEWTDMIEPSRSSIDFRDARLESIKDDVPSWPSVGSIQFDGLRFERFSDTDNDLATRLRWLALDKSCPAQAYRQLSTVYDQGGYRDSAKTVLFAFEDLRRGRQRQIAARLSNFLLKWTIGYGYQLWRAAVCMLLLTIIGFAVAQIGYRAKLIAPNDKDANTAFIATNRVPTNYPRFSASMFSLEHSLPAISLGVASYWSADTTARWPEHQWAELPIRYWFWLQTIVGWALSIFFIAGLSGAVRTSR